MTITINPISSTVDDTANADAPVLIGTLTLDNSDGGNAAASDAFNVVYADNDPAYGFVTTENDNGTVDVYYTQSSSSTVEAGQQENFYYSIADTQAEENSQSVDQAIQFTAPPAPTVTPSTSPSVTGGQSVVIANATAAVSGDTFTVSNVSSTDGGTVTVDANSGVVTYHEAAGAHTGTDQVTYTINESNGGSATITNEAVSVTAANPTVTPSASPAVTGGQSVQIATATAAGSGDTFTVSNVSSTDGGTVAVDANSGVVTYQEAASAHTGTDQVTYTINESNGGSTTITNEAVSVTAAPPVVNATAQPTAEPGHTVQIATVTAAASGDTLALVVNTAGADGAVALTNGVVTYSESSSHTGSGTDSVSYTVYDLTNNSNSGAQTATVNLEAAPTVTPSAAQSETAGQSVVVATGTVGSVNGTVDVVTLASNAAGLTLQQSDGAYTITYTDTANVASKTPVTLNYTVTDTHGGSVSGSSTVNELPALGETNAGPVTADANHTVVLGALTGFIPGDTYTSNNSAVSVNSSGQIIYAAGGAGTGGTVSYTISNVSETAQASVTQNNTVTVTAGPVANESATATVDAGYSVVIGTVSGGTGGYTVTGAAAHGTISLATDGSNHVLYTSTDATATADTAAYSVTDSDGVTVAGSTATTVTILTDPTTTAVSGTVTVDAGQAVTIGTYAGGDSTDTVGQSSGTLTGAVALDGAGHVTFTPSAAGTGTVTYTVHDSTADGAAATATADVTVLADPSFTAGQTTVDQGQSVVIATVSGGNGSYVLAAHTDGVSLNGDQIVYTAPAGATGSQQVTYSVHDTTTNAALETGTSTVTVDADPTATAGTQAGLDVGQSVTIGTVSGGNGSYQLVSATATGANGTVDVTSEVSVSAGGVVTYTPTAADASETVTYVVTDTTADPAPATGTSQTLTISALPTTVPETATVEAGHTSTATTLAAGATVPASISTVSVRRFGTTVSTTAPGTVNGRYGQLTLNADGTYSYAAAVTQAETLALLETGNGTKVDTFSYTVTDANGESSDNTLQVTVALDATATESLTDARGFHSLNIGASTLVLNEVNGSTYSGVIRDGGDAGKVVVNGTAALTLTNAETYTGATQINGELVLDGGSIADSHQVNLRTAGAVLDVSANGNTSINDLMGNAGTFIDLGGSTLTVTEDKATTFAGVIQDTDLAADGAAGGELVVQGSGTLTLTGQNTYTGGTTVNGALAIGAGGSISTSAEVYVANGGVFDVSASGGATINDLNGSGLVDLGAAALTVDLNQAETFSGVIQDADLAGNGAAGGKLVVNGTAALTLTGANTYTGSTQLNGELVLGAGGSIADSSQVNLRTAGAALDVSATTATSINNLIGKAGTFVDLGGATLTVTENKATTFAGVIQNSDLAGDSATGGKLVVNGTAALTLTGHETYTGATQINGELALGAGGSIAHSSQVNLRAAGAVFDISATTYAAVQDLMGNAGTHVDLGGSSLAVMETKATTFAGVIQDTDLANDGAHGGNLGVIGAELTLTGANTFTGFTLIASELALGAGGSISDSAGVVVGVPASVLGSSGEMLAGGSALLDVSATGATSINSLEGLASAHLDLGGSTLTINQTMAGSFAGVIEDGAHGTGGSLVLDGSALLTLSGQNTFTGGITLEGSSSVELAAAGAAGSHFITFAEGASAELVVDGAALSGSGSTQTLGTSLVGFASGDAIDLTSLAYNSQTTTSFANGLLTVSNGTAAVQLVLSGVDAGTAFSLADDGHGHVLISEAPTVHVDLFHG